MREILFRGKRLDNGEWVEGGSIIHFDPENNQELVFMPHKHEGCTSTHDDEDNITAFESGMFYKANPATVGQYTGLTDKNGTKIFEGDIVRHYNDDRMPESFDIGCIIFNTCECMFRRTSVGRNDSFAIAKHCLYEVIGNIHDNPELMGGETT